MAELATGPLVALDDPDDPRLEPYRHLTDAALRAQVEQGSGVFVAEGRLAVEALVGSGLEVVSMLVAEARVASATDLVASVRAASGSVMVAPATVVERTVGFALHRGIVAIGRRPESLDAASLLAGLAADATVVALEGVNDHENLGALFRNAAALGAAAVVADPTCADPYYRRSVRVSLGHVLGVPFARLADWPSGLDALRAAGWRLVALTPRGDTGIADVAPCGRTLLLVGAEGPGLSEAAMDAADLRVRIPLRAGVDSLNLAAATAVALHRLVPEPGGTGGA